MFYFYFKLILQKSQNTRLIIVFKKLNGSTFNTNNGSNFDADLHYGVKPLDSERLKKIREESKNTRAAEMRRRDKKIEV